jgi:hypothetical protein
VGRHGGHPSSRISKGATAPIAHLAFIRLGGLTLALPGTRFAAPFEPFAMRFPATTAITRTHKKKPYTETGLAALPQLISKHNHQTAKNSQSQPS